MRRGGFLLPSEALCRSPELSPREEQRTQGHDVAASAPDPKEDGKRPSHPPAQAAGSLPSRSVRSTPGDPLLLANKNVLGRGRVGGNLLGAPGCQIPSGLGSSLGLPLSLVPP